MNTETEQLRRLIAGMRAAYERGENAMAYARAAQSTSANATLATLIAYDLQAGTYNAAVRADPATNAKGCEQLARLLAPWITAETSLLEVGCGEATTLAGILKRLPVSPARALGFDLSWSRCDEGRAWLKENGVTAELFVADLFQIPLADESVDVVYTSHSLEPNGGREEPALRELLRVARRAVVLVEPLYELANDAAQKRMEHHGYVRGLAATLTGLEARIVRHELLPFSATARNPSGVIIVEKPVNDAAAKLQFRCPLTHSPLREAEDVYVSDAMGLVYPVLRGTPMLRAEHAIVASKLE
jgi:SAM-dependent methyltransferase